MDCFIVLVLYWILTWRSLWCIWGLLVVLVRIVIQRPKIELCSRRFHNKQSCRKWQPDRATLVLNGQISTSFYPSFCEIFPNFIQLWNATFLVVIHDKEGIGIRVSWSQRWTILYTQTLAEGCQVSEIWLLTIFLSRNLIDFSLNVVVNFNFRKSSGIFAFLWENPRLYFKSERIRKRILRFFTKQSG